MHQNDTPTGATTTPTTSAPQRPYTPPQFERTIPLSGTFFDKASTEETVTYFLRNGEIVEQTCDDRDYRTNSLENEGGTREKLDADSDATQADMQLLCARLRLFIDAYEGKGKVQAAPPGPMSENQYIARKAAHQCTAHGLGGIPFLIVFGDPHKESGEWFLVWAEANGVYCSDGPFLRDEADSIYTPYVKEYKARKAAQNG